MDDKRGDKGRFLCFIGAWLSIVLLLNTRMVELELYMTTRCNRKSAVTAVFTKFRQVQI